MVRGKQKFKDTAAYKSGYDEDEYGQEREALNIMYDKRVFRGNTHGMHTLKGEANLTAV